MTNPIARFVAFSDRAAWRPVLGFLVVWAISQGIGFATMVPILNSLLGDEGRLAWGWIAVLAAVTVVHAVLHHRSVPMGNALGADLVVRLTQRIDERLAAAPGRSLRPDRADRLSSLNGYAIVVLMGLPSHVLRPLVAAVVTPMTVIVVLLFVQPWLALVAAAGTLVAAGLTWLALRLLVSADDGSAWLDRLRAHRPTTRPSQTVRLAAGDVLPWRSMELLNCAAVATCVVLSVGGGVSPAMAVALIVLSVLMVRPMMEAALLVSTVLNSYDVLMRIEPLLDAPVHTGASWPSDCTVEFADVVSAGGDAAVSFWLPAGSTTEVVGASDGLRLTLADLLTGDLRPSAGSVRIGGVEAADLAQAEIAARVARISATAPGLTVAEAERLIDSAPESPVHAREQLALLREAVAAGGDLPEADRWRLALLRATARDPALVIVDATAGSAALRDAGIGGLLTDLVRERTCLLLWGPGSVPPECDQVLTVDHAGVEVR